jgi:hypothetical protein
MDKIKSSKPNANYNHHQPLTPAVFKRKKNPPPASTNGSKTEAPAAAGTPTSVPKPTTTDTAAAPSTSEPTAPAAGTNRLRRLSDKTTLIDLFSGAAPVEQKAPEPAAPTPGATPAQVNAGSAQKGEAAAVAAP